MTDPYTNFRTPALWMALKLRADFGFSKSDIAAILGNGGFESAGLTQLQEKNPLVKGSRGGFGLMQWTGLRRRRFEAYAKRNGYNPADYKIQYKWLFLELKGSERQAVDAVKKAASLESKVIAFERSYLRAGIKHYPQRVRWARHLYDELPNIPTSARPEPKKPSASTPLSPLTRFLAQHAFGWVIHQIEAKAKETNAMNFLSGYKTYITGIVMIVIALALIAGITIPGFEGAQAGQLLTEALAIIFLRKGISTP